MNFIITNLRRILMGVNLLLLAFAIYLVVGLLELGDKAKEQKIDYATLHSVEYGLFNSAIWADKIADIVDEKIDEFDFTEHGRNEIKEYIKTIIDTIIVEADHVIRKRNKKSSFWGSIVGTTKQVITDTLIDLKDMRRKVPVFTNALLDELEKPANQKLLKAILRKKLEQITFETLEHTDMSLYNGVLRKYHTTNYYSCNAILNEEIMQNKHDMEDYTILILILASIILFFTLIQGSLNSINLFILSATAFTLLVPGLMLPMLDIEAKIGTLYFLILDKPLLFTDQVLFFQSKSIYDLVTLLMQSEQKKMIFVGILLILFSVIFPTLKLLSTYLHYYFKSFIGNNMLVKFFALYSTKWSMADVMVVSIFMAYLGLDSVINKELEELEVKSLPINVITTNGTELQVGFFLFLGFVVSSFILSILLSKKGGS